MKNIKRAIHFDFHTMPDIPDLMERFDAKRFAARLSDAGVEYINFFARCNEGFSYYPTNIGVRHPYLKGDMLGDIVRECHKVGIGVTAYLNAGYDHEAAIRHRDWTVRNPHRKPDPAIDEYFIDMCYHTGPFRDHIIDMIKEIADLYPVDGFFVDCMGVNECYCPSCMESMKKLGYDPRCPEQVIKHVTEKRKQFCKDVKAAGGEDKHYFFNMLYVDALDAMDHIEIEGLPGGQGYDFFLPQVSYARNLSENVLYMTARFQKSWADFGGVKTYEAMEYDAWDALMYGCGVSIGDHLHPAEDPEPHIYEMVKKLYSTVKTYEPYTEGTKYLPEIGILTASKCWIDSSGRGACRMLAELKYQFDIVNEDMDLSRFDLLILPDNIVMTEKLKEKISAHLKSGKGIISSGTSGTYDGKFLMDEWGVNMLSADESNYSYFKMKDESDSILADVRWSMYDHGIKMSANEGTSVLADYVAPYFNRHVSPDRGYFYTPPKGTDSTAAVTRCKNVYHVCFNIFRSYYDNGMTAHRRVIEMMLDELISRPLIIADSLPKSTRVTLMGKEGLTLLQIKADFPEVRGNANVIEDHVTIPGGKKVSVRGEYSSASLLPGEQPLEISVNDGYTTVTLPEIYGYVMIGLR